ncbi:MAG: SET domain-containing protein-lysine N-methyltransferase [Betaproteobacteria bacterium]|nr:SET domain-containing protein-lysine N-methyltransferase [Betaproteobacteria bacterium]
MPNAKQKLLAHLSQEVYCHLGVSPVHGIGVFAIRAIAKGINPLKSRLKFEEVSFSHKEIKALPRSVRKEIEIFCYYDDDTVLIPSIGLNSMHMAVYLNHSKTPSVQYQKNGQLITLRAIKSGEELMMDYDVNFGASHIFD